MYLYITLMLQVFGFNHGQNELFNAKVPNIPRLITSIVTNCFSELE